MATPTFDVLSGRWYVPTDVDSHSRLIRAETRRELSGQNDPGYVRSWMDTWYATSRAMAIEDGEITEDWPE